MTVRETDMSYSGQSPASSNASNSNNSNNNSNSNNSGSQYATAALGVGLVALAMVMIVWSVVPAGSTGNSSRPEENVAKNTSSVAFVLLGTGVAMLLLSFCLSMRNKRRAQRQQDVNANARIEQGQEAERQTDQNEGYAVPSYEEVVGSDQYPVSQFSTRNDSTTHLPAYEELMESAQVGMDSFDPAHSQANQSQNNTDNTNPTHAQSGQQPTESTRRNGRPGLRLIPLKVRRIKSEKLGRKNSSGTPPVTISSIEPLTPPPQYEDKPPDLPPLAQ